MVTNETLLNGSKTALSSDISSHSQSPPCLPYWVLNAINIQYVYASDIFVTIVNILFAFFAFLANLAVIVTIIRTPSLHRPVNVLLCSLAIADCLAGLVAQPVYASWRFLLHHIVDPCKLLHLYQATKSLPFLLYILKLGDNKRGKALCCVQTHGLFS